MSSKKASLILSAALLSATIILTVVAVIMAGEKPSITGAAVYQPNIPSYCYNNVDACINLDEDSDIDADDESVFAQLLDGTITNASLIHLADFDNDTNVTNAIDFQKCFVPLMNYYQDIYDGEADCNLPQGMFTEPNLSNCLQGCPDLDGDGYVDNDDYDLFHSLIGNETEYTNYPTADMTGDGFIGAEDKSCMSLFIGRIVTCNLPTYFKHTSNCPDLTDEFDVGNDGYVDANDLALFNTYSNDNNLKADFNGDGSVNEADRVIFNKYYGRIVDCDIYHAPWHVGGMHHQNIKEESTYALFGGAYNLSQSFVANCMHDDECMLTKVRLHLKNISGNPSDIVVKVYDSNTSEGPNQTYVIATTSITPSFEFNISRWVTIPFNDPPTLDKNKMYHLVVSSPNSDNQSYAWYYNDVAEQNVSTAGASWHGESDSDYAGKSVASGDINNDGYDDIIIGASNEDTGGSDGGAVYIVFGPEYSAPDNLSNADVKIFSESAHDWLGYSLATGDINNDGYDDIITGSYREDTGGLNAGAAYVVYGPISSGTYNISNVYGAKWYGESSDDVTGASVAAGDVNNDGYDDIIIGGAYGSMGALPGTVYVIYGPDYSTNNLSYADVKIYGESNGDFFSASLAVGDIDNDGYDDLIMGAYGDNTGGVNAGAAYVVSGQISSGTYNISSAYAAKWYGESSDDWAGDSVAAGDVNNDGYDDIVIGAYGAEKVYLVYGPSTGSKQLDSADAIFTGGDKLGRSVLIADIDNDGFDDIIASAPYYDISTEEGAVYVVYGPVESGTEASIEEVWGTKWYGEQNNELIGFSNNELAAGDIDDDGYNDLLVGANLYDEGSANEAGKAYLFYSPPSININGSYWNQTPGSGWAQDSSSEFLFQLWLSSACADLNDDGVCDSTDETFILQIPDQLRSSGTNGWNDDYDLNGDGRIDTDDSAFLSSYISIPHYNITMSVSCPVNSTIAVLGFGSNTTIAQPFRASQDYIYYVDLYLRKSTLGSGTKDIKVEIRNANDDEPIMSGVPLASDTIGPITSETYSSYRFHFDSPASIVSGGKYFIVALSESSVRVDDYEWMACGNLTTNDQNATVGEFSNQTFEWAWNTSDRNMSFVVYNGNTDSLKASLDINNDNAINSTDFYIINSSVGNWSGDVWSGKVDFNAEFGLYEKLKDYTLGFKAYLNKVVTCGLLNWPEGVGNGRCDIDAPFNENYSSTPSDCPQCNYDNFCSISENPNNCTDCIWDPVVALYNNRTLTWDEDTNYTVDTSAWFSDPDNDSYYYFTYINSSPNITVTINTATGSANLTPGDNFFGVEFVNFSSTDTLSTVSVITTLNVTNVDDAPYLISNISNMTWPEDVVNTSLNISSYFKELDDENLAFSLSIQPSNVNVSINQTTGIVTLTPDGNWSGINTIRFTAEDPNTNEADSNNITLNVTAVNDPPYLAANIPNQSSVMDRNITLNMSNYFADVENNELNYTAVNGTNVTIIIDNTTKIVIIDPDPAWNGTSWAIFTATDGINSKNSTNVSLYFALGESILIDTRIDSVLKSDGNYTNLTYVVVSNLTSSNITSSSDLFRSRVDYSYVDNSSLTNSIINTSTIINSTLIRCNVSNSTVKNYYGADCVIEDSEIDPVNQNNVTGSTIVGNSRIYNSNVTFSYISASNITDSDGTNSTISDSRIDGSNFANCTVENSYLRESQFYNCTILNGTIYNGTITFNGVVYNASADGAKNLTDIINYLPEVSLTASSTSINTGTKVTFTIDADDLNLGGELDGDLFHTFDPGEGNINIFYPNTHQTWNKSIEGYPYRIDVDSEDNIIVTGKNGSNRMYTLKFNLSGDIEWNKTFGSYTGYGYDVAVDLEDNIIVAGQNSSSGIIVKYNNSGDEIWNTSYTSAGNTIKFLGVDTDSDDNITAVGRYYNGSDFYSLIVKYNSSGEKQWENKLSSGSSSDQFNDVVIDSNYNIIAVGEYGTPEIIIKYLPNGTQLWNITYNLTTQWMNAVAVDSSNNIFALSYFSGGDGGCFLSKHHPDNGTEIWNKTFNPGGNSYCSGISLDSEDNILIAASEGNENFTTIKLSEDGTHIWNVTYDSGSIDSTLDIVSDSYDNIIATGNYPNDIFTVKFKPMPDYPNNTINHTYSSAGTFNASITVKDAFNETALDEETITASVYSPPPSRGGGGGGGGIAACAESWNCTGWEDCTPSGIQFRTCYDANACGTFIYKPADSQACGYTPTCDDFVLNQDETDVDCGGSCSPCSNGKSCFTDIDCENSCVDGVCAIEAPPAPVARPPSPPPRPPVERPAEIGFLQREVFGVSMWIIIAGAVAAVILVSGGIFAAVHKKKKPAEMPSYTYLDSLRTAIKRDIIRGVPETDIRQTLLGMGWPVNIVDQSIKEINKSVLLRPVKSSIARGYDEIRLKQALVEKGWPMSTVDDVIKDVNLSILKKSMKNHLAKGKGIDDIKEGMLQRGWPEDTVIEAAEGLKFAK